MPDATAAPNSTPQRSMTAPKWQAEAVSTKPVPDGVVVGQPIPQVEPPTISSTKAVAGRALTTRRALESASGG